MVSTFWGDPRPYVDAIHANGALHLRTVGSADEAGRAVEAGVDVIVAQGWEAGGRVWAKSRRWRWSRPLSMLSVRCPVLAAGGVADGRGLAAALVLGADAAWVGTRFLLAQQASVHDEWRSRIEAARETSTVYSTPSSIAAAGRAAPHTPQQHRAGLGAGRADTAAPARPGEGDVVARRTPTAPASTAARIRCIRAAGLVRASWSDVPRADE